MSTRLSGDMLAGIELAFLLVGGRAHEGGELMVSEHTRWTSLLPASSLMASSCDASSLSMSSCDASSLSMSSRGYELTAVVVPNGDGILACW